MAKRPREAGTGPLLKKIASLEKQVTDQELKIKSLESSEQQLKASEQQLKATEQQLKADEQQLRASEQQLKASEQQLKALNQQLTESEQKFRSTVESISDGFFMLETEKLVVTYFNREAERLLGRKAGDVLQRPLFDAFPEARGSVFEKKYLECLRTGKKTRFETHFATKPYSNWYLVSVYPTREKLSVFFQVITEQKKAEQELRHNEEKLTSIFRAAPVGIGMVSKRIFTEVNHRFCEMVGYTRDELVGNSSRMIYPSEDAYQQVGSDKYRQIGKSGKGTVETQFRHKSGRILDVLLSSAPIKKDNGGGNVTFTALDITERKRAEQQREEALENLRKIEWLLEPETGETEPIEPAYGDLTALNENGLILKAVGKEMLKEISGDYLGLLGTSTAVYEKDGSYALGIFSSGWCRFLDDASRNLCGTRDNRTALRSGCWLCHESCWKDAAMPAMEKGQPADIECHGGIRLFALPIRAFGRVIGAINFGYGDPPSDREKLAEIAGKYRVPIDKLVEKAAKYESRPPYIIEMAKQRLEVSARLIGEIVERWQVEQEEEKHRRQLRELNNRLVSAQEEERRRISLELHDELGQAITALAMNMSSLKRSVPAQASTKFSKLLTESFELVTQITGRLKEFTLSLRPSMLDHLGLEATLRWYIDRIRSRTGLEVTLQAEEPAERLPAQLEIILFRALQEALNNIVKHAEASSAQITIEQTPPGLHILVEDDGKGFDPSVVDGNPEDTSGLGLLGMRERLLTANGRLEIDTAPGNGTRLHIHIPLEESGI